MVPVMGHCSLSGSGPRWIGGGAAEMIAKPRIIERKRTAANGAPQARVHLIERLQAGIMEGQHDQALAFVLFSQLHQIGLVRMADGAVVSEEV